MIPKGYEALTTDAAWIDFSARGRLCLVGADRQKFLHGQVTNNVQDLKVGQGCYAALTNAKGKMNVDLNIFILQDEILLDFEPGYAAKVSERLEKFIIADDVQIVDASASFGLVSVIGPNAAQKVGIPVPENEFGIVQHESLYVARMPRGVNIFYPRESFPLTHSTIPEASIEAFEADRIERGIPRFGADMDENTLVPEAIEHAISYNKGCYIGQEVIARIRTYGQVAKALRSLRFALGSAIPKTGDKILNDGKEVGWITSACLSPKYQRPVALGYVRKECNQIGTRLNVGESVAEIYDPAAGAK